MAKNAQDSNESLNAISSDAASEANPYINDDTATGSRFGWIKSRAVKITAISIGSALALGAAFAGGAVAGQVASHNNGPSIGAPFGEPDGDHEGFGKRDHFDGDESGKFAPDGDFAPGTHPRPPHGPDRQQNFPDDQPTESGQTDSQVQSN